MQVYIVMGGADSQWGPLATTETLLKDGGTSWGMVTSVPFARTTLRGISLPNGRFFVTGGIHYPEGRRLHLRMKESISHLVVGTKHIHKHFRRLSW